MDTGTLSRLVRLLDALIDLDIIGTSLFEWLARHPNDAAVFDANMSAMTGADVEALFASGFDFGGMNHLVDVGGGRGRFASEFLARRPDATALVVDRSDVIADVVQTADPAVRDRLSTAGGSFFDPLPRGGDVYVLKDVLHDWDDERATVILRRCADAAGPRGTVLIIERLLDDPDHGASVREVDISMLALTGGHERTRADYLQLLEHAGLTASGVHRSHSGYAILACRPEQTSSLGTDA